MPTEPFEIRVKGKPVQVPSLAVGENRAIVQGNWLKLATIHDDEWLERDPVSNPEEIVAQLKGGGLPADAFTFAQRVPEIEPKFRYRMEWDNVAAIPITKFEDWWEKRLPQVTRKNVRRSRKRGVTVAVTPFSDELVRGITAIYNETQIKQGIPFAHYGKDFETVKREISPLLERSEFIGAYFDNELIGFIKLVYMGQIATILHIVTMDQHYDKRPGNALMTRAVELCEQKKMTHLLYGKYTYGNKTNSPLAEFKARNGFEQINVPRYYIPLTLKGRLALALNFHRGLLGMLPPGVITFLLKARATFYRLASRKSATAKPAETKEAEGDEAGAVAQAQ